ncbi:MAG: lipocalin family protein [Panacagrimonas sp.]
MFAKLCLRTVVLLWGLTTSACATFSASTPSPVPLAPAVDLQRYAGDWYLIAHIPTSRDVEAHNAQENYAIRPDGSVGITYRNRLGGFDGKHKLMTPTAYVIENSNNALWGVRFGWYWPFVYEYRIAHVEPDYSVVVVARSKRDFVWLFSRTPQMDDTELARYAGLMKGWGYDVATLMRVPQQWPNPADGSMPVLGPLR